MRPPLQFPVLQETGAEVRMKIELYYKLNIKIKPSKVSHHSSTLQISMTLFLCKKYRKVVNAKLHFISYKVLESDYIIKL